MYAGLFTRGTAAGALGATTQPFLSATQSHALAMVMDAVARRAPVALLTGEAGVGKTALLHEMAATLFGTPVQIIKVAHPLPRPLELQRLIATPLGLPDAEGLTPTEVARALAGLAASADPERRILLLADDAHLMPQETLRYLGLMTELLGGRQPLLQIVLSGRPPLLEVLRHPDLAPLLRRVDLHAVIESLTSQETRDYLDHRLGLAGLSVKASLTQPALSDVLAHADGSPREIDAFVGRVLRQRLGGRGGRITRRLLRAHALIPPAAVGRSAAWLPAGPAAWAGVWLLAMALGVGVLFHYRDTLHDAAAAQWAALQDRLAGPPPAAAPPPVTAAPAPPVSAAPPAPRPAPPAPPQIAGGGVLSPAAADAVIADLLTAAQVQIADGRISAPPHDNVLESFQALNEVLPHASPAGREMVMGMTRGFAARARAADAAGRHAEADRFRMFAGTAAADAAPSPTPSPNTPSPNTPSPNTPSPNTPSPNTPALDTPPAPPVAASPAASPPTDALPLAAPPHVILLMTRSGAQADQQAAALAGNLRGFGLHVDDAIPDRTRDGSRIEYFYAEDSENAMLIAHRMATLLGGERPVVMTRRDPAPPPGTVEVVLP